jgi:hypothetical protein
MGWPLRGSFCRALVDTNSRMISSGCVHELGTALRGACVHAWEVVLCVLATARSSQRQQSAGPREYAHTAVQWVMGTGHMQCAKIHAFGVQAWEWQWGACMRSRSKLLIKRCCEHVSVSKTTGLQRTGTTYSGMPRVQRMRLAARTGSIADPSHRRDEACRRPARPRTRTLAPGLRKSAARVHM